MAPRLTAALVLAFALLPLTALIPGGELDAEYAARLLDWTFGTLLCAGIGGLTWYILRARRLPDRPATRSAGTPGFAGWPFVLTATVGAFALYATIARLVFSGRALHIDEIVQVLQARWLAEGQLSVATPPLREFFSVLNLVDLGERTFAQFPVGGPAMLMLGSLVGAEWLVGPLAGAVSVLAFAVVLGALEPTATRRWHRGALTLFVVAPFGVFMFGSHMNHATTLAWLLVATAALARATRDSSSPESNSPWWGLLAGLGLGVAATIRPLDAVVFALPAGAWLAWRARAGGRAVATLLLSGVGVALPIAGLLYVNAHQTGRATLFGYDLLWGAGHGLGFHPSPWGPAHTPARGVELIGLYFTRLSTHLLETPFPSLLPAAVGLVVAKRLGALDRYLFTSGALLVLAYGAYWHDGSHLGPRFMFALLPVLVLWSARVTGAFSGRAWTVRRGAQAALASGALYALVTVVAVRAPSYRNANTSMRVDVAAESRGAGVKDALVLVRESWGAQLVVRLWALGVPRASAEQVYRRVDACTLDRAVEALERDGVRGDGAVAALLPLQADSARLQRSPWSPDGSERFLPGTEYAGACAARVREDRSGYSLYAPFRLVRDGNVYARWLPGRESEIAAQYPDRPVFVLGRASDKVDAPLTWTRWRP